MNIFERLHLKYRVWRINLRGPVKTTNLNIRAYRTIAPDGNISYTDKTRDGRGSHSCSDIANLAAAVKWEAEDHIKENGFGQVTIDFHPFHDIEKPSTLAPHLCKPLNEAEREEFWKYFNK